MIRAIFRIHKREPKDKTERAMEEEPSSERSTVHDSPVHISSSPRAYSQLSQDDAARVWDTKQKFCYHTFTLWHPHLYVRKRIAGPSSVLLHACRYVTFSKMYLLSYIYPNCVLALFHLHACGASIHRSFRSRRFRGCWEAKQVLTCAVFVWETHTSFISNLVLGALPVRR